MPFALFFLGLFGLWAGAEVVLWASLNIAKMLKMSETFVGLMILSLGTSLPELFVATVGGFQRLGGVKTSELIVGETMGTTMSQIGFVLGITGLLGGTIMFKHRELIKDGIVMIGSVGLFFLLATDGLISRWDGFFLLSAFLVYAVFISVNSRAPKSKIKTKTHPLLSIIMLVIGFIAVVVSSQVVTTQGIAVSKMLGLSEALVGIIFIGAGTSLPELVVSLNAMAKGHTQLSLANMIGSNIFDLVAVMGISSFVAGWKVDQQFLKFDLPFLFITSLVVVTAFYTRKKLEKKESALIFALYFAYLLMKFAGVEIL